ncbi:MAG: plasmid pRiA4b ORF-3 family protein, partial [Rhodothermales bacterium]
MTDLLRALRFRIELDGSSPLIWREIDVPTTYSFWDLHVAIQDAMGWLDYHLHLFHVKDPKTDETLPIGIPDEDGFEDDETLPGWDVPVIACLNRPGHNARYEYDFGDSWQHSIVLKDIFQAEKGVRYPRCGGGQRSCPPEDCGGVHGYREMLKALHE